MIDAPSLWQLTEQACDGMLGLPIACCDDSQSDFDYAFTAQIKISGDADALLALHSEKSFARHLAATMFMADSDELSEEEVHDALGELINIVAGNVKGMVPGESLLSLPCVGAAMAIEENVTPGDTLVEIRGTCEGHGFMMLLASSTMSAVPA